MDSWMEYTDLPRHSFKIRNAIYAKLHTPIFNLKEEEEGLRKKKKERKTNKQTNKQTNKKKEKKKKLDDGVCAWLPW